MAGRGLLHSSRSPSEPGEEHAHGMASTPGFSERGVAREYLLDVDCRVAVHLVPELFFFRQQRRLSPGNGHGIAYIAPSSVLGVPGSWLIDESGDGVGGP